MQKNFLDTFNEFIRERVFDVADNIVKCDREFTELYEESEKVFKDIQNYVPEESKELLSHYENLTGLMQGVSNDLMYRQGFKDAVQLFYLLIIKSME